MMECVTHFALQNLIFQIQESLVATHLLPFYRSTVNAQPCLPAGRCQLLQLIPQNTQRNYSRFPESSRNEALHRYL